MVLLPHSLSFISDTPEAVEGYELGFILPFYLHPALLQADNFVPPDDRSIAWSASIDKLHLCFSEIKLGIMPQTQEKGVTGPHPTRQAPFFRSG